VCPITVRSLPCLEVVARMPLRAKASAFGHPKSPHASALKARPFTAALQVLLPRAAAGGGVDRDEDGDPDVPPGNLTDVSGVLQRRMERLCDGGDDEAERGGSGGGSGNGSPSQSDVPDYYIARLTLPQLFDASFLARHVRAPGAALHALCIDGRIDRDDIAAITPSGHAHLSLTPRTYARMGVTGVKTDRGALKFSATINLANPKFKPGEPYHDRFTACADAVAREQREHDQQDDERRGTGGSSSSHTVGGRSCAMWYLCAFESHGAAAGIVFPACHQGNKAAAAAAASEASPRHFALTSKLVGALDYVPALPSLGRSERHGGASNQMETDGGEGDGIGNGDEDGVGVQGVDMVSHELIDFHEWVGAVSCGCVGRILREETRQTQNLSTGSKGPKVHTECSEDSKRPQKSTTPETEAMEAHKWEGLLLPSHAASALDFCRVAVDTGGAPWAALTLWGFADDPAPPTRANGGARGKGGTCGGGGGGQGAGGGGGDELTFLVLPGDRYVMFSQPS